MIPSATTPGQSERALVSVACRTAAEFTFLKISVTCTESPITKASGSVSDVSELISSNIRSILFTFDVLNEFGSTNSFIEDIPPNIIYMLVTFDVSNEFGSTNSSN